MSLFFSRIRWRPDSQTPQENSLSQFTSQDGEKNHHPKFRCNSKYDSSQAHLALMVPAAQEILELLGFMTHRTKAWLKLGPPSWIFYFNRDKASIWAKLLGYGARILISPPCSSLRGAHGPRSQGSCLRIRGCPSSKRVEGFACGCTGFCLHRLGEGRALERGTMPGSGFWMEWEVGSPWGIWWRSWSCFRRNTPTSILKAMQTL